MNPKTPRTSGQTKFVFLFDVDNTLLDNDRVQADMVAHELGGEHVALDELPEQEAPDQGGQAAAHKHAGDKFFAARVYHRYSLTGGFYVRERL